MFRVGIWHSQITIALQPSDSILEIFSLSRSTFPLIFIRQKSGLVFGHLNFLHSCPCQKQPWTNMAVLYFGRTMSGLPGKSLTCRRYRKPALCRAVRTNNSGLVSLHRILDIIRERVALSTTSAKSSNPPRDLGRFENEWRHALGNRLDHWNTDRVPELAVGLGVRNWDLEGITTGFFKSHQACTFPRS